MEKLSLLFFDSLMSKLAFTGQKPLFLEVMLQFPHEKISIFLTASFGIFVACIVNYYAGFALSLIRKTEQKTQEKMLSQIQDFFEKWGFHLLLLASISVIGTFLTVLAGLVKFKRSKFLIACAISIAIKNLIQIF